MYEMLSINDFLIYCSTGRNVDKVEEFIKKNNINLFAKVSNEGGINPNMYVTGLMMAVFGNQKEIVQLLLDNNASTDIVTGSMRQNVLHYATMNKGIDPDIVSLLLKNMSLDTINKKDIRGRTPLDLSILSNNNTTTTLIEKFINRKAFKAKLLPYSKLRYKF